MGSRFRGGGILERMENLPQKANLPTKQGLTEKGDSCKITSKNSLARGYAPGSKKKVEVDFFGVE